MPKIRFRSRRGSALLLVILLSGFMLVSFIAFSGTVRQAIKSQSTSYVDDQIKLDQFRESSVATGTGTLPEGYFLDPSGPIRRGSFTVHSGSTQQMDWKTSGTITLTRTLWAPFCYAGSDGGTFIEGCVNQSKDLTVLSMTGSLVFSTLGGYSGVAVSPVSSVSVSGSVHRIFREMGNATFLEKVLVQ